MTIRVFAPATVANLGPGFDILGLAVTSPGDIVTARQVATVGTTIVRIEGDGGRLPLDAAQNTAGIAAEYVRQQVAPGQGVALEIEKGLPLASGLGSSAASAVAGAVAVNALFGNPLERSALVPALLAAESAVSGPHLDNVAPALLGGLVLVTGATADTVHSLPTPPRIFQHYLALVTPDVAIPTAQARAVLPDTITLTTVVAQTKSLARLLHAVYTDAPWLLAQAMMEDRIIEPARSHLIPHYNEARQTALEQGAMAVIISGAGPTIGIMTQDKAIADRCCEAVQQVYKTHGMQTAGRVVQPSSEGARVL